MNVMLCISSGGEYRLAGGRSGPAPQGDATHLGIRPEHIQLAPKGRGACDGVVDLVEYLGADTFLVIDCGELGRVTVRLKDEDALPAGAETGLHFEPAHTVFFDSEGLAAR